MIDARLFLLEKGDIITVRNENNIEISFSTYSHFLEMFPFTTYPIDLTKKYYVDYEPGRNYSVDDTAVDKKVSAEDAATYDLIIADVKMVEENIKDPYFKLSLEAAKTLRKGTLKTEALNHFEAKYSYMDMLQYMTDSTIDRSQVKSDYQTVMADFLTARDAINACGTTTAVKAVVANWRAI